MIHFNSKDAIFIKKIHLQIWTLNDQIRSFFNELPEEKKSSSIKEFQQELKNFFNYSILLSEKLFFLSEDENKEIIDNSIKEINKTRPDSPLEEEDFWKLPYGKRPAIAEDLITKGNLLLYDINIETIFFFSEKPFIIGQSIIIKFLVPSDFSLCAEVVSCSHYGIFSNVISDDIRPYRIYAKFTYLRRGEMMVLRNFLKSIEIPKNLKQQNDAPAKKDDDDDGELDLGELGL